MADDRNRSSEALERELQELGPLMLRQEIFEAQAPDAAFAEALRSRLVSGEKSRGPIPFIRRRSIAVWTGWSAAAAVAAVLAVALVLHNAHRGTAPVAGGRPTSRLPTGHWTLPTPSVVDLTKSYPLLTWLGLGGGATVYPTLTDLQPFHGDSYPRPLHLSAGRLPEFGGSLPAYRLAGPRFDVPRVAVIARRLGIHATAKQITALSPTEIQTMHTPTHGFGHWLVAADGRSTGNPPLHSIAIFANTGEAIYHDAAADAAPAGRALDRVQLVAAARRWLVRLGWPGRTMPEQPSVLFPGVNESLPYEVSFGWADTGPTDAAEAILRLTPGGRVAEAVLLPPAGSMRLVPVRSVADAFQILRRRGGPVGVEGVQGVGSLGRTKAPHGSGIVRSVRIVEVFTHDRRGNLYLVPAYQCEGTVKLVGVPGLGYGGEHRMFALVPAVRR